MTRNAADAEDLTQEPFLRLFLRIGSFRGEASTSARVRFHPAHSAIHHNRSAGVSHFRNAPVVGAQFGINF